jgi:hypothetical protein
MCGSPERLTSFGAPTFLVLSQQNDGSESIVVETVVYHVAEPQGVCEVFREKNDNMLSYFFFF